MDVTVCVGTFGEQSWVDLAEQRAIPSAQAQGVPVVHEHGETLAKARNAAARNATTEWLCFLDADDELAVGYFDAMSAGIADLRGPAVEYIPVGRSRGRLRIWPEQDLRDGNYLVIGTLVRRDMFLEVGGFHEWPLYEDWCLWQRCWRAGATIEVIPQAVYRAHARPDSRNRAPDRAERLRWHHEIRQANFPELYSEAAA